MPTKPQGVQATTAKEQESRQRDSAISKQVMQVLGQPSDLQWVQVRLLWEDRFRVNVLVGADAASARVAHSFFLVADDNGNILTSTPKIIKQY